MDLKKIGRDLLLLPNLVTLSRLLWTGLFVATLGSVWQYLFFVLAFLTDPLDGRLARARDETTRTGVLLDPVVGKLSLLIIVLVLVPASGISSDYIVLFLLYPFFTLIGAVVLLGLPRLTRFDVDWVMPRPKGKWVANLQFVALAALLLSRPVIGVAVLWLSGLLAVLAGVEYTNVFVQRLDHPVTRRWYAALAPPILGITVFGTVVLLFLQAELVSFLELVVAATGFV